MASRRTVLRGGARIAVGVVALLVGAAALMGAQFLALPGHEVSSASVRVMPRATDQQRVCPGSLYSVASGESDSTSAQAFGQPSVTRQTSSGDATTRSLTATDAGSGRSTAPLVVTAAAPADGGSAPLLGAAQSQTAGLEDLTGVAAAACTEPSADSWLVAGATDLGATSVVLLANPTEVEATVALEIFGESGPVDAPGATGISVPAGTQRVVALAGLAPDVKAPVVHVTATGGRVAASLEQSIVRGITPGGVELAGPVAAPSGSAVVPGVRVSGIAALAAGADGYSDELPAVRVLSPDADTTVRVGATAEDGTTGGDSAEVDVKKGVAVEVPLPDLADGVYDVTVEADAPIVASARTSVSTDAGDDFAWYPTATPLTGDALVAVARGENPRVHVANPTRRSADFSWTDADGATRSVTLQPGAGVGFVGAGGRAVALGDSRGLVVSVEYSGDGLASAYAVSPPSALARSIVVRPR